MTRQATSRSARGSRGLRIGLVAYVVVTCAVALRSLPQPSTLAPVEVVVGVAWVLVPLACAAMGAFIVARRPRHSVGWLLLVPGLAAVDITSPLVDRAVAPAHATVPLLLGLWLDNVTWVLLVMPIFLVLALFPTGRPISPRWRWHVVLAGVMTGTMFVMGALAPRVGPVDESWSIPNPLGVLPAIWEAWWFFPLWTVGLLALVGGALSAMVVRYRRAGWAERQQLKWLLYAVAIFAVAYGAEAVRSGESDQWSAVHVLGLALPLSMVFVPVAIAIAILRHQVLDIDLVIRRTIAYAVLVALLTAVYVGSVVAFGGVTRSLTGVDSSVGVAASTLLLAALFNPLRIRVRSLVDRRFFRGAYDPEGVLRAFTARVRDETDTAQVRSCLVGEVQGALHPHVVGVWLSDGVAVRARTTAAAPIATAPASTGTDPPPVAGRVGAGAGAGAGSSVGTGG